MPPADQRDVQASREWIFREFSHDPWCATLREGAQCHCWLALKPQALAAEYARVRAETLEQAVATIASVERPKRKGVHSYSFAKARGVFTRAILALAQPAPQGEK